MPLKVHSQDLLLHAQLPSGHSVTERSFDALRHMLSLHDALPVST
jgi:hypothetical protein